MAVSKSNIFILSKQRNSTKTKKIMTFYEEKYDFFAVYILDDIKKKTYEISASNGCSPIIYGIHFKVQAHEKNDVMLFAVICMKTSTIELKNYT